MELTNKCSPVAERAEAETCSSRLAHAGRRALGSRRSPNPWNNPHGFSVQQADVLGVEQRLRDAGGGLLLLVLARVMGPRVFPTAQLVCLTLGSSLSVHLLFSP